MSAATPTRPQRASAVMTGQAAGALLQRKCACGSPTGSSMGECEECRKQPKLQRATASPTARAGCNAAGVPAVVHEVLRAPGRPLDKRTRDYFEPLYGHDFSRVRVHTDSQAAQSARSVNALAFTVAQHVVFGAGQYAPDTTAGRGLLAHELAHTIQQQGVPGGLQRLSLDDRQGPMEREADSAASQVLSGRNTKVALRADSGRVQGFSVTSEPAGGCGICYDVQFPGKGPQNAGRVAHTVVQAAFMAALSGIGQFRFVEFPFSAPGDENGRLDLAVATPTGFAIGEIKPATPNGETEGTADLAWYTEQIMATHPGSTVEPLMTRIPVAGGLPMPDALATAASCTPQFLGVVMMRPGIYGYFCQPPYSQARSRCPCRPRVPVPPPVPVPQEKEVKEKVKERTREKDRPPIETPIPAREIALALAAAAGLAAAASKLKGLAKGRLLAAATAIAIVVLLAKGAEASVGPGEDPIETLIKSADATGQHLPDDIKEAMRKDPKLRALLEKAAKTGNFDEAQREAAENLTRLIAAHRDEFTDEELEELLKATEGAKRKMPDGELTVDQVKKAIEAKKRGASGSGTSGAPGGGGTGSGSASGAGKESEATVPPASDKPAAAPPRTPAERLVEGMARPAEGGPKFTESARQKLLAIANSVNPPLTDVEVDELLKQLGSAAGKTEDEVVATLRNGVTRLRTAKQPKPADETQPPDGGPAAGEKSAQGEPGSKIEIDKADPKQPPRDDKATIAAYDALIAKMDKWPKGKSFLAFPDPAYQTGKTYSLIYLGRDDAGVPFVGQVEVTIKAKHVDEWDVTIAAGAVLYTKGRRYGTTRRLTDRVRVPAHLIAGPPKSTQ